MYFNEEIFKTLKKLEELPDTEEKKQMSDAYQKDEITAYELADKARDLIKRHKQNDTK